jgi:phytoene synthase
MQATEQITRKSASNLALAFVLLPVEKRQAMTALYAFCREVDDVADEDSRPIEARRQDLAAWREDIRIACHGGKPAFVVNQELQPFIQRFHLPFELFDDLLRGVEMDLETLRFETFEELELYCYRVASVVGLLSIEIFGYRDAKCREYAVHLGQALQLTNILRDVANDAERGRIYLPLAELRKLGVTEEEILQKRYSANFARAAEVTAERARAHYEAARNLLPPGDRPAMVAAELMGAVYWKLLRLVEARKFDVFSPPKARLGKAHKLFLILRTWCKLQMGSRTPNYGVA